MKRIIALLLAMAICLLLSACGKSDAAIACENLINAIGEVTLDSKDAIAAAENAYSALTDEEKESISESKEILKKSRALYVSAMVNAIGEITLESEESIISAENAYTNLSEDEKALIQDSGEVLRESREQYEVAVMNANAEKVISTINAIGNVTIDSAEQIGTAREMYNALSVDEKELVDNYSLLTTAETDLEILIEEEKQIIIDSVLPNFDRQADRVADTAYYVPKVMPKYCDQSTFVVPYIATQGDYVCLKIRYNYVGDDWVFWESLVILADEQRYTIDVGYNGVVRDIGDNVYEVYDQSLVFNTPLTDTNIQMLKDIAEADEAIVRFDGDAYRYDYTVSAKEKEAMRDVVKLYSALIW